MTANQLQYWANQEAIRANKAREFETERSNKAKEQETYRANLAKEAENYRSNVAKEQETKRHNKWSEAFQGIDTATNLFESPTRGFKNLTGGASIFFNQGGQV